VVGNDAATLPAAAALRNSRREGRFMESSPVSAERGTIA
jgi:hypothetical protein